MFLLVLATLPLPVGGVMTAAVAAPHAPASATSAPPVSSAAASPTSPAPLTSGPASPTSPASARPVRPAANPDCTLTVPPAPLTARGLATPYRLSATHPGNGPCHEANPGQSAFVQAMVYDPATGALSVYDPLVVDAGRRPAAPPITPAIPADAVVGLWFGFNGNNLTLRYADGGLKADHCVNGLGNSVFAQYAYCDATAFYAAVKAGIAAHKLTVPALGTADDGEPCPTTRDFSIVDQDQSDNVTTRYLVTVHGGIAQDTLANALRLPGATVLSNPSDNALLDTFVDPALGCTPWTARNLDGGGTTTSIALDEIQAAADQSAPAALVPLNDPMTTVSGAGSADKTNLYRAGVDQPPLPAGQTPRTYCRDMDTIQAARLQLDRYRFSAAASPDPAAATDLFTFLGARLNTSFQNLGCTRFGLADPVSSETVDKAGVVAAVTFAP
jgi:hypothetical protein